MRDRTTGEAVNAMGLNGLGWSTHARYRGPRCFQQQPTSRLLAPRVAPTSALMLPTVGPWRPSRPTG